MDKTINEMLFEIDIASLQAAMELGTLTAVDCVRWYLERIERFNPILKAVLEVNPDAIAVAESLDEERQQGRSRGPLHGIPIVLKDNIDTGDRMHTSAGSVALANHFAPKDSYLAAQLRAAGTVFLGKANMTEWANFMSPTMWAGYSSRGGLTLNPYGPGELFVGGSSSGSGVSVAANLCTAAIGTETSGSIISPSSQNYLVGLKPTIGLVSRSGIIPITQSQDSAGPMTRTVRDAAILLSAMTDTDLEDASMLSNKRIAHKDYTRFLDLNGLSAARIGVPRQYYRGLDQSRLAIIERAIALCKECGAIIIDPISLPCESAKWDWDVMRFEFKKGLNDYLAKAGTGTSVRTLDELIAYNETNRDSALKYGQDTLIWSNETSGMLTETEYIESLLLNQEVARGQGIDHAIREYRLDALLFLGNEDGLDLSARAGYPAITVPGGYAETGIIAEGGYTTKGPQGITFVGTAYSEPSLFRLAYAYEQASNNRFAPPDPI
ncbi:MAG: amidase family protein [Candidatus Pristimantibacillus lignocellulolyticus]|uniref:Amidase family protein n=1 Tax=Candidatus Pristimantibacillus lignocellulolyticus TaxID=2994561 RepID=A0A9J6ZAB3_9BACL|nr:MAG: amidase family protein [Candidatus Pristimantibacillus lignocellulolyticus]